MSTTYLEAIREGLWEEMERDPNVFLIGEDIGTYGGAFKMTAGFLDRFGERRVVDTPISESAIVGAAIGASLMGLRPVAEIQFSDFITCGYDQIVNYAAKCLIKSAVRDGDPVLFFEHKALYRRIKEDLPTAEYTVPIGKAAVVRPGKDLSIVTYGAMVHAAAEAANSLQEEGISVEIVDLRTLSPLDEPTILESVRKTSKAIVLHEATLTG